MLYNFVCCQSDAAAQVGRSRLAPRPAAARLGCQPGRPPRQLPT
jgi:hypothetical protein